MGLEIKISGHSIFREEILEKKYDLIDLLIKFISRFPAKADKTEYHLKKIPQLEDSANKSFVDSEIYNVKKFLINYREISLLISEIVGKSLSFSFESQQLLELLSGDNPDDETFYLSASYSEELKNLREHIKNIDDHLKDLKEAKILHIKKTISFDFRFHDFLVVDESDIPDMSDQIIYIEPYDNCSVLIKPILGKEFFDIHSSRKELIDKEKKEENRIKEHLLSEVKREREQLIQYEKNILNLDRALAGARLSLEFNSVRPDLIENDLLR